MKPEPLVTAIEGGAGAAPGATVVLTTRAARGSTRRWRGGSRTTARSSSCAAGTKEWTSA